VAVIRAFLQRHGPRRLGFAALAAAAGAAAIAVGLGGGKPGPASATPELRMSAERPISKVVRSLDLASWGAPLPGHAPISPFGLRQLPWETRPRLHAGVDIVAPEGTVVQAVAFGEVTRAGSDSGYGNFVEVEHLGGLRSFYAHLSAIAAGIRPGATVVPGAALGRVGNTGSSTGAHLHFEMRNRRGRPLDPTFFIGRRFARLEDWPLKAAAMISPRVHIAMVSNIPESKLLLMIARQEAAADEAAMAALVDLDRQEAAEGQAPDPALAALTAFDSPDETEPAKLELPPPPEAVTPVEAAPEPPPEPPPIRRPARPPRLAMPG
jgi:hypothetical protein